jgi:hypothetical protein
VTAVDYPFPTAEKRPVNWAFWLLALFTSWMWLHSLWAVDQGTHFEG